LALLVFIPAAVPAHLTLSIWDASEKKHYLLLVDLMRDCLILAKNEGADVFNALNLMDNDEFLKELKFQ
jgi:hypothetical protein